MVLAGCGHVDLPWGVFKAFPPGMLKAMWCEVCEAWREIERDATPLEIAGLTLPDQLPLGDIAPF